MRGTGLGFKDTWEVLRQTYQLLGRVYRMVESRKGDNVLSMCHPETPGEALFMP